MGVYEARSQLDKSLKKLTNCWQDARSLWDDAASEKFEADHLQMWAADLRRAASAMGHMIQIIATVRQDCK